MNKTEDVIKHKKLGKGEWVVISTTMTGGGTGHGPHDIYPDGHQITCRKLKPNSNEIDWTVKEKKFYQSGSFINEVMLKDPTLVRRIKGYNNVLADNFLHNILKELKKRYKMDMFEIHLLCEDVLTFVVFYHDGCNMIRLFYSELSDERDINDILAICHIKLLKYGLIEE